VSTVSRYLAREFSLASTGVFLAIFVTWISADSLVHIDRVAEDAGGALRGVLLRSLDIVPLGIPTACVIGVVWSLTRAVRFREITAIRAGGIPLRMALLPLLLLTLGVAAGLGVVEDRLLVPARLSLIESATGDEESRQRPRQIGGRWWYSAGSSMFSARAYVKETGELHDVNVFELDESREIRRRIDAAVAIHREGSIWEFRDARVREFTGTSGLRERVAESLELDLGMTSAAIERAAPPLEATDLPGLARRIRDQDGSGANRAALVTAFHARLAQPLAVVVLVLLALPFAIGDAERGDSLPRALLSALAASGLFWLCWTLALLGARTGAVPSAIPVWGALGAFLGFGLWRFGRLRE
jgi:lipopolysaccharide export system permease protein